MPEPIGPYSPEAVIEAIEENLVGASVALGRTEDGVVFRGSDVTWVYTGYRSLSRVLQARFTAEQAEDRVAEIGDCFKEWKAPVCWVIGPTSFPPNLGVLLRDCGFDAGETWLGLARDLSPQPADLTGPPLPPAFRVERATSKHDLAVWSHIGVDASDTDAPDPATADIFAPENAGGDPRCRYYLATVAGRPVARGMAYVNGDVVGLHWVSADPDARDKGYEPAVARRMMDDARQTGARLAVLPARGPAQSLGRRLGFQPYCLFSVHAWPPATTTPHA